MSKILPYLIHSNQSAFVKGRNIEEPLSIIQGIKDYVKIENKPILLFAADFEKSYSYSEAAQRIVVIAY